MLELLLFGTAAMDKIIQNRIFRPDAEWVDNGVVLHNSFWKTTLIISSFYCHRTRFACAWRTMLIIVDEPLENEVDNLSINVKIPGCLASCSPFVWWNSHLDW